MMKKLIMTLLGMLPLSMPDQNITDLAVVNDKSADASVCQGDHFSTVDDSVFPHPDRIRFDNRCIQIEGEDVFVYSGAFHYFRVPQPLWASRFSKKIARAVLTLVEYRASQL